MCSRRTVYDEYNDREIVLTKKDLKTIRRIKDNRYPIAIDPYPVRLASSRLFFCFALAQAHVNNKQELLCPHMALLLHAGTI